MNLAAALYVLALTTLGVNPRGYLLEFSGAGCVPCQQVAPIISKLEREGLPIHSVDIDAERALAGQYGVERVPTFVLIVDGRMVDRVQGVQTEAAIRQMLAKIPAERGGSGPLSVELGQSAPLPRPEVRDVPEPRPRKTAPAAPEKPGLGIWPFPRGDKAKTSDMLPVVRGNDSLAKAFPSKSTLPASPSATPSDPMTCSARIRVITGDSLVRGSGTLIESQRGKTVLLTCGHLFRNAGATTKIEVDLFEAGAPKTFVGTVVGFDLEADVGLITIPTADAYPVCPLASPASPPAQGMAVSSIGCSGGDLPSREQLRITKLNEFEGPETISCTSVPVQGRSGGGLFNDQGELIGVCFAADKAGRGGVYCGMKPIVALLEKQNLAHLVPVLNATNNAIAANEPPVGTTPWSGADDGTAAVAPPTDAKEFAPKAAPSVEEFSTGDAEVVIMIKTRTADGPQNKVILIQKPSRSFLKFVEGEIVDEEETLSGPTGRTSTNDLQPTGLETRREPRPFIRKK